MSLSGEPGVGVALSKCHGDPGVVYPMAGAVPFIQSSGCFDYMCSLEEDIKTDLLVTLPPLSHTYSNKLSSLQSMSFIDLLTPINIFYNHHS